MPPTRRPLADRFWPKVQRGDGCWEWTGGTSKGYGRIGSGGKGQKCLQAQRVAWELTFGPIPDGLEACHRCDNRRCVRPDHLFLGTHADNMADMAAKGRQGSRTKPELTLRGDRHGRAVLSSGQVYEARKLYLCGEFTHVKLSRVFGVSKSAMGHALRRTTWKSVAP